MGPVIEWIGQTLAIAVFVFLYGSVFFGLLFTAYYLVALIAGKVRRAIVRRLRP
ncbi:hypothetical protein [Longimicrobium sp.]|uniref:hypothetical protein n=1 Tax=Longimicrobium sp. TaxID=2029185 RepID=UPI002E2F1D16|nr:hypothetical protein [Longimicrobium sp.]HEX6038941.1 hypothetical protein [Longimicrobium sp.]